MTPNQRGSLFMTISMAGFAVEDSFIKAAAVTVPLGQILIFMGLAGIAWFSTVALRAGDAPVPRAAWSKTMAVRSLFEVAGRLFYALALALIPISVASAILQATPLVVVLGAAVLFGERVGLARWFAILLGFVGVLVILRPGLAGFDAQSLLALAGMLGFAGRDLATRAAPPALSNAQLGVAGFTMLGISGVVILGAEGNAAMPDAHGWLLMSGAAAFGIFGYACLTSAMRMGDVSAVTPFRYTRLVFAMIIGALVFHEHPDLPTLIGAGIIVACGLFILLSGRRRVG
jgi:drug/metabolite transporter (DMT)-like permease